MTRIANDRTRVNLYFDARVFDAMRKLAIMRGTTYSELIRQACRAYVLEQGGSAVQELVTIKELSK